MQKLEKILEEINILNGIYDTDDGGCLLRQEDVEDIICKHMHGKDIDVPTNDGWIPVEERLPEEDGTYLCTLDGELCGIEEPFTGMCGIEDGIWDEPDCVLAWRPLPNPYRPKVTKP